MEINPKDGGNRHEPLNHALNADAQAQKIGVNEMAEWIERRNEIRADMEILRANWTETRNPYGEDTNGTGTVYGFWCAECGVETYGNDATVADHYRAYCGKCGQYYRNCEDCGIVVSLFNVETFNNIDYYCRDCSVYHYPECSHCDTPTNPDEFAIDHGELQVCEDCSEHYAQCQRCEDVVSSDETTEVFGELGRSEHWCARCVRTYATRCDFCDDYARDENIYGAFGRAICDHCRDTGEWCICENCGEIISECYGEYDCECIDCYDGGHSNSGTIYPDYRDITTRVIEGITRDAGQRTFGVEVETEFPDNRCPFDIGGYHSDYAASYEFFGGWRAEEDCTVDAEFISPVLTGAAGIAEVAHTYRILQDAGAEMTRNAGQHITVDVGDYDAQINVQSLMFVLEDALIALTGSYSRLNSSMCRRVKKEASDPRIGATRGKFVAAGLKSGTSLVEFRYPPGTLSPEQLAINVGLTQLVAHLANTMPKDVIDGLVNRALEIEQDEKCPEFPTESEQLRMQDHIMHGLEILASFGWYAEGVFHGLPYDPNNAPVIELVDHDRNHAVTVELPDRAAIFDRMHRQLARFYRKAGLEFTHASQSALDEIGICYAPESEYAELEPEVAPEPAPEPPVFMYTWQDARFPSDASPGRYVVIDDLAYVFVGLGEWVWRNTTDPVGASLLRRVGLVPVETREQYLAR